MSDAPDKIHLLDESLQLAWQALGCLPSDDWCLAGGTAVALYFGHRGSTDLDWCAPVGSINVDVIRRLGCFERFGTLTGMTGGEGIVDCVLQPHDKRLRNISMTFLEPYRGFLPQPRHNPERSVNPVGTPVMHLIDLASCKVQSMMGRGVMRDYLDVAIIARKRPQYLEAGIHQLSDHEGCDIHRCLMALVSPPDGTNISQDTLDALSDFSVRFASRERGKTR